jgi:chorismate mutase
MTTNSRLWSVRGAVRLDLIHSDHISRESQMTHRLDELLTGLLKKNGIDSANCVNIQFTQTEDIDFMNAASAARKGTHADAISRIPLFCAQEPRYPGSLPGTIRVLITYYNDADHVPEPVYLHGAELLRKDIFDG